MSFWDHIAACNRHHVGDFIPFMVGDSVVGKVRLGLAALLRPWPEVFRVTDTGVSFIRMEGGLQERSEWLTRVLSQLVERGDLSPFHGERYAVIADNESEPLLLMDRAMAPYFGIRSFGQHVNGIVRTSEGMKMWIGRRAADRLHYPGCLDNLAAGGLPYGLSLMENLAKECWEEAGIQAGLACQAKPVGAVSYQLDTDKGFKSDTLYCYDLELPEEFLPCCMDGEVQEFYLWPLEKVFERVKNSSDFKLNCNLVLIDFFIRHGYIGPDDEDYTILRSALRPEMPPLG